MLDEATAGRLQLHYPVPAGWEKARNAFRCVEPCDDKPIKYTLSGANIFCKASSQGLGWVLIAPRNE